MIMEFMIRTLVMRISIMIVVTLVMMIMVVI
jgi:hypothetical protein